MNNEKLIIKNNINESIDDIMNSLKKISELEFKNPQIIELDKYFFHNRNFLMNFQKSIGGKEHHVYSGGLAKHTLDVMEITRDLCYRYDCSHKEIAILSAKLHDIGKIYEYNQDFSTTLRGEMEGHIVIGMNMIEEALNSKAEFYDEDLKCRIRGCIVQHHGEVKYGSPKSPNSQEAYIVHHADYLDCIMNKIKTIKADTQIGNWTEFNEKMRCKLYI